MNAAALKMERRAGILARRDTTNAAVETWRVENPPSVGAALKMACGAGSLPASFDRFQTSKPASTTALKLKRRAGILARRETTDVTIETWRVENPPSFRTLLISCLLLCFAVLLLVQTPPALARADAKPQETKTSTAAAPESPAETDSVLATAQGITLNFDRVDIRTFIAAISRFTGKNFVVTPEIKGEITIYCPTPLDQRTAYATFLSVLDLHGLAAVEAGEVVKIIPGPQASKEGLPVVYGSEIPASYPPDELLTLIYPVRALDAASVRTAVQGLLSKSGAVQVQEQGNSVMISDKAANLRRMLEILRRTDQPGTPRVTQAFPLRYGASTQIATKLQQFFSDNAATLQTAKPAVIDDPRTNSIIVAATEKDMKLIKSIIESLDGPQSAARTNAEVIFLEHADAAKLADVLNSQAKNNKPAASGTTGAAGSSPSNVIADPASNSLVLNGSPEDIQALREIIAKLDAPRSQVLVEAVILEISMKRLKQLGVEWRGMDQPNEDSVRGFGGTNFPSGGQQGALDQLAAKPFDGPTGLSLGLMKGTITFGGVEFINLGALLHAVQDDSQVNVLSTPRLMTLDNEEAEIIVGEERPYLKTTQTTQTDQVIRTYEFKDIGLTLRITPHISLGHLVRLNLYEEIKSFVAEADVGAVTTTKRQARTTVVVENSETIVIGGLIRDDHIGDVIKVPCLGSIPFLGWLFRNNRHEHNKTNLVIFLTPHILNSPAETRAMSQDVIEQTKIKDESQDKASEQLRDEAKYILKDGKTE